MAEPNRDRERHDELPPPEERTIQERSKRTLPMRWVYPLVILVIVLVIVVTIVS